jgi:hypothetical protein
MGKRMATEPQETPADRRPIRRRGLAPESDTPFSDQADVRGRAAVRAYRMSVYGLIPGFGLLLGPIAVVLGLYVRWSGRGDPSFRGQSLANAAILLGGLLTVTTWLGLALMILGWRN